MLPLLIIPGVILLGGALLSGDSDPPPTLSFEKGSPEDKVYQELKAAGVSDKEIDRGYSYFRTDKSGCVEKTDGAGDSKIWSSEVYQTARDLFLKDPENPAFRKILQGIFEEKMVQSQMTGRYQYQNNFHWDAIDYLYDAQRYFPFKNPGDFAQYLSDMHETFCIDPKGLSIKLFYDMLEEKNNSPSTLFYQGLLEYDLFQRQRVLFDGLFKATELERQQELQPRKENSPGKP